MTGLPQAAINAATRAAEDFARQELPDWDSGGLIQQVIEAAAPHIAAAERERIIAIAVDHGAVYAGDDGIDHPFDDLLTEGDPDGS